MQIPILNGIYTDENADYRTSYPHNLTSVPTKNGVSNGYLRPADGIVAVASFDGKDRGGINWNGVHYRVMGNELVTIDEDGTYTVIGDVVGSSQVTIWYSFDYLAIASNKIFYLYDGETLTSVIDEDLGDVIDFVWVDGYFLTTDGSYLVVTELGDPFSVNPLKYGSSEINPDPIVSLEKLRNEVYVLNRYTIEVFNNIGGSLFPFSRIDGAQIEKGCIGTHASCVFMDAISFLGGGINEPPSIWIGVNGNATKIATREIDTILSKYTEYELGEVILESRTDKGHRFLYVHLNDITLVYDASSSISIKQPIWFTLGSGLNKDERYRAKNFVYCNDIWYCGDTKENNIGYLDNSISSHYGDTIGWHFSTQILYSEGRGAIFHELELVSLTGRVKLGEDPTIWTSYSKDGVTFSQEKSIKAGKIGDRLKRLVWFRNGNMSNTRVQKFRGTSDSHLSIARLEARIEPLND